MDVFYHPVLVIQVCKQCGACKETDFRSCCYEEENEPAECPGGNECDADEDKNGSNGFWFALAFCLFVLCSCWLVYTKKDQIENLEMIERQDEVIKTYQIAKMRISGTARPSKVCSSQYYRRGFTSCVYLNISSRVVTSQLDPSTYTGYKTILGGDADE